MLFKFAKISPLKLKSNIFLKIKIFFHFTIKYGNDWRRISNQLFSDHQYFNHPDPF